MMRMSSRGKSGLAVLARWYAFRASRSGEKSSSAVHEVDETSMAGREEASDHLLGMNEAGTGGERVGTRRSKRSSRSAEFVRLKCAGGRSCRTA